MGSGPGDPHELLFTTGCTACTAFAPSALLAVYHGSLHFCEAGTGALSARQNCSGSGCAPTGAVHHGCPIALLLVMPPLDMSVLCTFYTAA